MQKAIEEIIEKVALKHNIPKEVVEAIFESQFQCAREEIKSREEAPFPNVRFIHLGMLCSKPNRVKHIQKWKEIGKKKDS